MSEPTAIGFYVVCEEPNHRVTLTAGVDRADPIFFNVSRSALDEPGPARIEAHIVPVECPILPEEGSILPDETWARWLSLDVEREQTFDADGIRNYGVRIHFPEGEAIPPGKYCFRLRVLGVDDPDEQFVESDVVTIVVQSKLPTLLAFLAVVLVVVAVAVTAAVLLIRRSAAQPSLYVDLHVPQEVHAGQVAPYVLTVRNEETQAVTHLALAYTPPPGVLGVTARVPDSAFPRCTRSDDAIDGSAAVECNLGTLAAQDTMTVALDVLPGPAMTVLTNTETLTVTSAEYDPLVAQPDRPTTTVLHTEGLAVTLQPSVGRASVGEPIRMRLIAWEHTETTTPTLESEPQPYTVTYTLPQGWRYAHDPPNKDCKRLTYFQIECQIDLSPARSEEISFELIPARMTADPTLHRAELIDEKSQVRAGAERSVPVAETALYFDGEGGYAELGVQGTPESLTVELWVHPRSMDDGQAFIGVHDLDSENLLLIGYYSGGLHVNLRGEWITVPGAQRTDRHHLAVVVQRKGPLRSEVSIYVNGILLVGMPVDVNRALDPRIETLDWVLGQDWDDGPGGPVSSDFFYGRISHVRLWAEARTHSQIVDGMGRILSRDELAGDAAPVGDWPLVPDPDPSTETLVERVSLVQAGLPDQSGQLHGASWPATPVHTSFALQFDGRDDYVEVPDLFLPTLDSALDGSHGTPYAVSLAAWVYVDELPSTAQWILGQAAPRLVRTEETIQQAVIDLSLAQDDLRRTLLRLTQSDRTSPMISGLAGEVLSELDALSTAEAELVDAWLAEGTTPEDRDKAMSAYATAKGRLNATVFGVDRVVQPELRFIKTVLEDGFYTVRRGEDLIGLGFRFGQQISIGSGRVYPGQIIAFTDEQLDRLQEVRSLWRELAAAQAEWRRAANWLYRMGVENEVVYGILADLSAGRLEKVSDGLPPREPVWVALVVDRLGYPALVTRDLGPQGEAGAWIELPDRKPLPRGRWVHLTGVLSYTLESTPTLTLYSDGLDVRNDVILDSDRIDLDPDPCLTRVYIGGLCVPTVSGGGYYRGRLDELRIWERALDPAEVVEWMKRPGEFYDETAYWPLDDGPGRHVEQGACALAQICNQRIHAPGTTDLDNDRYHLTVVGPAWVESRLDMGSAGAGQ